METPQCYTESKKPQCMIKICEDRSCHTPSPYKQLQLLPTPYFKMFWKDSLMTSHPHHLTSSIFHCYALSSHHSCPPPPPNKNFDHTPNVFRINEILTTLKRYFEGLRVIVNETNNNYQELDPLQYGEGHYGPLKVFLMLHQKVCNREMKLSDFCYLRIRHLKM